MHQSHRVISGTRHRCKMYGLARISCLLLLMVASGSSIKCYVCEYNQFTGSGSTCRGPIVDASHLTDCTPSSDKCAAVFHTVSAGPSSFLTIRRQCLSSNRTARCVDSGATQACSCTTDGCNNVAQPSTTTTRSFFTPNQITTTAAPSTTSGGRRNQVGFVVVTITCLAFAAFA